MIGVMSVTTKSFLKNVTIKGKKNCAMFVSALENASQKGSKEIVVPQVHIATTEDVRKMFANSK